MAATHKGAISFGLVHIPIALHTATQDNDIRFNQLCKEDGSRVKYKKVCANCGKEVTNADIVKGFEYEDGKSARYRFCILPSFLIFRPSISIRPITLSPKPAGTKPMSCCAGPCTRKRKWRWPKR